MTYYAVVRVTMIDDSWVEEYLPAVTALCVSQNLTR